MKVLLVNGSPRKDGCTNRALEEIKSTLEKEGIEAQIFYIGPNIKPCMACGMCKKNGKCIMEDSVNEFALEAKDADGFIFGSPVYYSSMSSILKCFLDRVFYSASRYLTDKPGAAVVSCRRGGATLTFDEINMYFMINNMPVISSQYWNQVHGNTKEEVEKDIEGLQTMRTLGQNMAYFLKCKKAGDDNGVKRTEREKKIATNFIK